MPARYKSVSPGKARGHGGRLLGEKCPLGVSVTLAGPGEGRPVCQLSPLTLAPLAPWPQPYTDHPFELLPLRTTWKKL